MRFASVFVAAAVLGAAGVWWFTRRPATEPVRTGPVVYVPAPQTIAPATSPQPAARPSGVRLQTAAPTPAAAPAPAASALRTPSPVQQAATAPPVAYVRPEAPPQILSVSLSTSVASPGQVVNGTVETSSNVASVQARIGGYGASMQKVGVGTFALSYRVPNLPFFLRRTYLIQVIAQNTRGTSVSTAVPITIK